MRKITSLLMLLCVFVGTAWAQLVQTSTAENPIYYVIASYNRGGVVTYGDVGSSVEHKACTEDGKSEWYFESVPQNENNGVYIVSKYKHNGTKVYLDSEKKATATPAVWYILKNGVNDEGYSISSAPVIPNGSCLDASNAGTGIGGWNPSANDWHGTTWVIFDVDDEVYNPNKHLIQKGTGGRNITSITVNGTTENTPCTSGLAYVDYTGKIAFTVATNSDVAIAIGRNGNWMHSYAYIDIDANGFTEAEVVSYSYYEGKNSKDETISQDNNAHNTIVMPNFTAPSNPGTYRMRVKYDWDNLDPNGAEGKMDVAGGQFVDVLLIVTANPLAPIIPLAEALYASAKDNTGTAFGEYPKDKVDALATAIEKAKAISDVAATTADAEALQAAMDAVKRNLPTPGKYYLIHSSLSKFAEHQAGKVKAAYSDGTNVKWTTANEDDKTFYWQAVETSDGGVVLQNAKDGKYMTGNKGQSGAWTVSDTYSDAAKLDMMLFAKGETADENEYGVILNGWQMHCEGHYEGTGESGNVVSWNTDKANSASSWYVVEVELPVFYDVTYNFVYNKEVKFTKTVSIKKGAAYPDIVVPVIPYGVTTKATKPEGTVTQTEVKNFELIIEKELPVKAAANVESIDTWYFIQMHGNHLTRAYIEDNGGEVIDWNDKSVANDEIESHLWGFVGDVFGMKMVNKKTGKAIASTGSGNATMAEVATATSFVVTASNGQNDPWFCMKYPTNDNYLNAQGDQSKGEGCINHYHDNDNGSSFFATEYKTHNVVVGEAGYATLYLGSQVFIPETVEAYVVSEVSNGKAIMTQVTGSLPANTGVILKGIGTHKFITSADVPATIETNLLTGTTVDSYVNANAYVLANDDTEGIGLYKAMLNKDENGEAGTTHFLNNANKAYLPASAVPAGARFLSFDFGTETAIESIEGAENGANAVIYDLAGRRVLKAQKGLYIVNGVKVIK